MSRARLGFCAAAAIIAAAIANPLVEVASNAGWFGPGNFTDHSNLDVVPTLIAGLVLLGAFMLRKASAVLSGQAVPGRIGALVPAIFTLQIITLYLMESGEQLVVFGHLLGPAIWLGAPLPISMAIHAAICIAVTLTLVRSRRRLAATALCVIRFVCAIATLAVQLPGAIAARRLEAGRFVQLLPIACTIGVRAPPLAAS